MANFPKVEYAKTVPVTDNSPNTLDKPAVQQVTKQSITLSGGIEVSKTPVQTSTGAIIKEISNIPKSPNNKKPTTTTIITKPKGTSRQKNNVIDKLRQINWSRSYNWDVNLQGVPAPFDKNGFGFPAVDVEDAIAIGNSYDFDAGIKSYRFPYRSTYFDIKLTFLDDENGTLEQYFEQWFFQIYSEEGINYLSEIVRELKITKLTSDKREIFTRKYLVYPEGTLYGVNKTDSSVRMFTVDLMVASYGPSWKS